MDEFVEKSRLEVIRKIKLVQNKIDELNGKLSVLYGRKAEYIKPFKNEATTILSMDCSALRGKTFLGETIKTGSDFADALYRRANVLVMPGEAFMYKAEDIICRITLSLDNDILLKMYDRISTQIDRELHLKYRTTDTSHSRTSMER